MATNDELALAMRAGQLAQSVGWEQPQLVSPEALTTLEPRGAPVIVVAATALSLAQAQDVAALAGAGRPVALVTDAVLGAEILGWLPARVLDPTASRPSTEARKAAVPEEATAATDSIAVPREVVREVPPELAGHLLKFKVQSSGVYGGVTFISPRSYLEIRAGLVAAERALGGDEIHRSSCQHFLDGMRRDHDDFDCYDQEVFDELWDSTPALLQELTIMNGGLHVSDDHPDLRKGR